MEVGTRFIIDSTNASRPSSALEIGTQLLIVSFQNAPRALYLTDDPENIFKSQQWLAACVRSEKRVRVAEILLTFIRLLCTTRTYLYLCQCQYLYLYLYLYLYVHTHTHTRVYYV